jgi:hypothetical protein
MLTPQGAAKARNVGLDGCVFAQMFAQMVAESGGCDLLSNLVKRIGCWKSAELSARVAEKFPVFLHKGLKWKVKLA